MPPVKPRDMEDTWNPAELGLSLKESKDKKRRHRDKDGDRDEDRERRRKEKHHDDDDRKHRRRREEDGEKHREKRDRDRDRDKDRDKTREKDKEKRDKDRDRERRHRDKENGESESKRRSKDKDEDEVDGGRRRRRPNEEDDDKEKRHRRRQQDDSDGKRHGKDDDGAERRRRRHNDEDDDKEKRQRRHQQDDDNDDEKRKRREERRKKRDEEGNQEKEKRRHKDGDEKDRKHRDRDKEREHRKRRDDKDGEDPSRRHRRDENGERQRERKDRGDRDKDKEHRDRERRREKEQDLIEDEGNHRRHRDKERDHKKEPKEVEETKKRKSKSRSKKEGKTSSNNKGADDDDEYNYDDDFEDYEEDFEEDDDDNGDEDDEKPDRVSDQNGKESPTFTTPRTSRDITSGYIRSKNWGTDEKSRDEMDDILRAMDAENDRLLADSKRADYDDTREDADRRSSKRPTTGKPRSFINFVSAKQRVITNKASMKAKTRGKELLQIIELDKAAYDLFDMPPVGEYELYIRTFGRSDTKQKYIQTNEDNIEKDIQTEEIETREMWCQCPPEDTKGCGNDKESTEDLESKPIDTVALTKFVQKAGQTMLILLEEDKVEAAQSDTTKKRSNICLSEAFLELEAPSFLAGRCVSFTQFSEAQTHLMLSVYDRPTEFKSDDVLSTKGAICVWNVNETSQPQKILVCEGQPRCCCFSPVKPTLVFAGMSDGSLAVWDLREDNSIHKAHNVDDQIWYLRSPTYNTAGVLHYENHQSGVTSITPIYVPESAGEMDDSEIDGSTSFQLASVEETATVHLWVVAEISSPEPGGSESDLGLAPNGRVKLIKSSVIKLDNPLREARLRTTMKAFEMQLLPSDPSHFYVGTDTGHIIHGVRFGGKAPPKAYKPDIDAPIEVTSLDFSPFTEPVFLAGCADGSIRLYHIGNPAPLLVWESTTNNQPILTVRWCQSRPSVFFVVDVTSRLYIWDLLMSDAVPMKEEKISQDRLTSFCVSKDYASTGLGVAGRKPAMAVSFDDGRVEVHTVSQQFSALMPEEVDQFAQFLSNAA